MNQETLDNLIAELLTQDILRRVDEQVKHEHNWQPAELAIDERAFKSLHEERISKALLESLHDSYEPKVMFTTNLTYSSPASIGINSMNYSKPDTFYVHVPSWVKVHRAPFTEFGSNLFGLAYTTTGDVHIREDLEGMQFSEVLFHEVMHQLYPNSSEQDIRRMVLGRMGSSAEIHTHLTRP